MFQAFVRISRPTLSSLYYINLTISLSNVPSGNDRKVHLQKNVKDQGDTICALTYPGSW